MYESLTRFLLDLESGAAYGTWVVDRESEGTIDDPIRLPFVNYGPVSCGVIDAVYAFVDARPEYELGRYGDILEKNGLAWDARVMEEADVAQLDGQAVMALLLGAVRADRFCEGTLLRFLNTVAYADGCRDCKRLTSEGLVSGVG